MSRKHYIALAEALARTRPDDDTRGTAMSQWRYTRDAVMDALQRDNPNFDRARFIAATED